jgi:hypothetical protein
MGSRNEFLVIPRNQVARNLRLHREGRFLDFVEPFGEHDDSKQY